MNTSKIGDAFEERVYSLIEEAIKNEEFGIIPDQCKVEKKKKYYSSDRKKDITFDLTIEVWPPGASRPTSIWFIECKNYTHSVSVDDLEVLNSQILQVSGLNVKAVIVTKTSLQEGAYNYAKSRGMMIIEVTHDDKHNIILHNTNKQNLHRSKSEFVETDLNNIPKFLILLFEKFKIRGVQRVSKRRLEMLSESLIKVSFPITLQNHTETSLENICKYLEHKHGLKIQMATLGYDIQGKEILGCYDAEKGTIFLNIEKNDPRYPFILAHEIGHFILHRNVRMGNKLYNEYKDSEYDLFSDRHLIQNEKNQLEWQANYFAAALLMPRVSIIHQLLVFQCNEGIRNKGKIYLDDQPTNIRDFGKILAFLSNIFHVNKTNIQYRLHDLGRITQGKRKDLRHHLKETVYHL